MNIGILALQGAFVEHERALRALGATTFEIRQKRDLVQKMDGLILPGGESTVMRKLLHEQDMFRFLHDAISSGLPVFGTFSSWPSASKAAPPALAPCTFAPCATPTAASSGAFIRRPILPL